MSLMSFRDTGSGQFNCASMRLSLFLTPVAPKSITSILISVQHICPVLEAYRTNTTSEVVRNKCRMKLGKFKSNRILHAQGLCYVGTEIFNVGQTAP
jgi:hypothetical protein